MDISSELPRLKSMLMMAQSKIDKWMVEVKQTLIRDTLLQGQALEEQMNDLQERAKRLQVIHRELKTLTMTMDTQLHEKELVAQELEQTQHLLEKERNLLEDQDKTVDDKLKELNHVVELFRDRLSFTFKKTAGNRLQMVFTNIDRKDPNCPFYFYCQVENGNYIISDCEPAIADLDALVEKLNNTNNIRSFIVAVRKRFKKMVENH